jgi:hypothetical protein
MALPLPADMFPGAIFKSNSNGMIKVIKCIDSYNVYAVFVDTNHHVTASAGNIRKGKVKDKTRKDVYGVGCFGDGEYKATIKGKVTNQYRAWSNMMSRCYSEAYKLRQPTYEGCVVCREWLNYQNFAKWFCDNSNHDMDNQQLDKDLLKTGNKEYSPGNCVLIPKELNLFTVGREAARGMYPIGCSFNKSHGMFESYCNHNASRIRLGLFSDPIVAHLTWYRKKVELAYEYKEICDKIHPDLFAGLLRKIDSMKVESL